MPQTCPHSHRGKGAPPAIMGGADALVLPAAMPAPADQNAAAVTAVSFAVFTAAPTPRTAIVTGAESKLDAKQQQPASRKSKGAKGKVAAADEIDEFSFFSASTFDQVTPKAKSKLKEADAKAVAAASKPDGTQFMPGAPKALEASFIQSDDKNGKKEKVRTTAIAASKSWRQHTSARR